MEPRPRRPIHEKTAAENWFTFTNDQRCGPFSEIDIRTQLIDERLADHDYIWAEGMKEWVPISRVAHFSSYPASDVPAHRIEDLKGVFPPHLVKSPLVKTIERNFRKTLNHVHFRKVFLLAGVLAGMAALGIYYAKVSNRTPFIPDISTEDDRALREAIGRPVSLAGLKLAIAVSHADPSAPSFYVGGNSPDGTRIVLKIEGIPETLLSPSRFQKEMEMTLRNGIAHSPAVRDLSGATLPTGMYRVSAMISGGKSLAVRNYFLGGLQDQEYSHSLAEFHRVMRSKAATEIRDLKELTSTLETQLLETDRQFREFFSAPTSPERIRTWETFHRRWSAFSSQLSVKSPPEELYYDTLSLTANRLAAQIIQLHTLQDLYVKAPTKRGPLELRIVEVTSLLQSSVISLRMKTNLAERAASVAIEGLPNREGI